ncbi:hypothetical protein FHQ18_06870 [Deferribacter autotrophicus]|uniref:Twin-arginine translocation signal domain-containing protein n=1 Tax=Deferribacter autotrophicus TaxID=500465 RepID=A0A5A8F5X5_9BACT|nr:hypothetical protein [Deferribacter autotrophicus]KAA0258114.1 hypothetical protein FHQ18_06870 [Deferribacter autotrophicus]
MNSKRSSRREFLKLGAITTVGVMATLKGKKVIAKELQENSSEILYRETEHFKKYYESLRS